jgi:hypothetical protein
VDTTHQNTPQAGLHVCLQLCRPHKGLFTIPSNKRSGKPTQTTTRCRCCRMSYANALQAAALLGAGLAVLAALLAWQLWFRTRVYLLDFVAQRPDDRCGLFVLGHMRTQHATLLPGYGFVPYPATSPMHTTDSLPGQPLAIALSCLSAQHTTCVKCQSAHVRVCLCWTVEVHRAAADRTAISSTLPGTVDFTLSSSRVIKPAGRRGVYARVA